MTRFLPCHLYDPPLTTNSTGIEADETAGSAEDEEDEDGMEGRMSTVRCDACAGVLEYCPTLSLSLC